MKILDFFSLFVADAPMKKNRSKNLVLPPLRGLLFLVGKISHALEGQGILQEHSTAAPLFLPNRLTISFKSILSFSEDANRVCTFSLSTYISLSIYLFSIFLSLFVYLSIFLPEMFFYSFKYVLVIFRGC